MTATQQVKANKKAETAPKRKALIEKAKTLALVIIVTFAVGFYVGNNYGQNEAVEAATVKTVVTAPTSK